MKRSTKMPSCSFGNSHLKRWLLKIGPTRRILLLKKFKENLVNLGLPRLAVRKGLLQLASRPIVRMNRLAVTQIRRKSRMKGPRSRNHPRPRSSSKERERRLDNNNNSNICVSQEYSPTTNASCKWKHTQKVKRDRVERLDHIIASSEQSRSGAIAGIEKDRCREKKSRSTERRLTLGSGSISKMEKQTHRKSNSRKLDPGINPNRIHWRLIPIDMKDLHKSLHSGSAVHKQQIEKKKRKDRIRSKFLEIFGEDEQQDPPTSRISIQNFDTTVTSKDTEIGAKDLETILRKSPVFCNVFKKRKKTHDRDRLKDTPKKCKPANADNDNASDTTVVDNTSGDSCSDDASTIIGEEITARLSHAISTTTIRPQSTEALGTTGEKSGTAATATLNADKELISDSRPDFKKEQHSKGSSCQGLAGSNTTLRTESVIVQPDRILSESPSTSQVETETIPGLGLDVNHETEFTQEARTTNSSLLEDNSPKVPIPPYPNGCLKHEPAEPTPNGFGGLEPLRNIHADCFDDGLNPTSTTDTLPLADVSCDNDRLFGALDNICLALHCRRRIDERQKTANKLAIKRNRQEEILKARHELESRMIVFREEILYLSSKLKTWREVIQFVCEGLAHRTPTDVCPFSESEIEAVMLEADIKTQRNISEQKESPEAIPKPNSEGSIICEIDLTEDNETIDLCDSSTDPPKFPMKYSPFHSKLNSGVKVENFRVPDELSTPSIAEVTTISPQQFDTIGDKLVSPICEDIHPCFVCSLPSSVACGLCGKANYCSKGCQELDWMQSHHATCIPSEAVIRWFDKY